MFDVLHKALCILLLILLSPTKATKVHACQEAVKTFFEFTREAEYSEGIKVPSGSEITFVFASFLGLYKFKNERAFTDCNMEEATVFGAPGEGHKAETLPIGRHYFALEDYCRQGRKLKVIIHSCAPCVKIYFDAPFGFGVFVKQHAAWVSQIGDHEIRNKDAAWELSVGHHTFRSSNKSAPDHPPQRAMWKHQNGVEFEIVLHCDACQDDPKMYCDSLSKGYCNDETYSSLMRLKCPRFCGYFELMKNGIELTTKSIEIHTNQRIA